MHCFLSLAEFRRGRLRTGQRGARTPGHSRGSLGGLRQMEVTLEFISFASVPWETEVLGGGWDGEGPSGRRTPAPERDRSHTYLTSVSNKTKMNKCFKVLIGKAMFNFISQIFQAVSDVPLPGPRSEQGKDQPHQHAWGLLGLFCGHLTGPTAWRPVLGVRTEVPPRPQPGLECGEHP